MYPVFESGQKVFASIINDWESINEEVWVCFKCPTPDTALKISGLITLAVKITDIWRWNVIILNISLITCLFFLKIFILEFQKKELA